MNKKYKPYLLLSPVLILLISIFVMGLSIGLLQSLGYFKAVGLEDITLKYYKEMFQSKDFLESLKFSLYISFVSSVLSVILGILLAYTILRTTSNKLIEKIYKLPVVVPHIVGALLIYNILSQNGIAARVLYSLNIIKDANNFPSLLYEKNGIGIILVYLWKEIPFIAMTTYTILKNLNDNLKEVALNLGASNRQVFFYVILPLIMPTVLSSFIIIFAFSFGAYELPLLLGPTSPKALSIKAHIEYTNPDLKHRPYAMVVNMTLALVSFVLIFLYTKTYEIILKYKGDKNEK